MKQNNFKVLEDLKKQMEENTKTFIGIVKSTKEKYGFLVVENHADVFIPPIEMDKVFSGDKISLTVQNFKSERKEQKFLINKIIDSQVKKIIGKYKEEENGNYVYSHFPIKNKKIRIPKNFVKKANNEDYVVVELLEHPFISKKPKGKIIDIIGSENMPGFEIEYTLHKYGIKNAFSNETRKEIEAFNESYISNISKNYKDLTHVDFVSIDGENTNDIDDLLYAEKISTGWNLLVAIADVSAFVHFDSSIDKEAFDRTSSVYFLGKNIPMLPQELSSDLCSLKENTNRLALVCDININTKGEVIDFSFYEATVCSKAKMNYKEIENYLSGYESCLNFKYSNSIVNTINTLYLLHKALKDNRNSYSTLSVTRDDYKIVLDQNKKIKDITPFEYKTSNRIVEECMLIANICASKFVTEHKKEMSIYRATSEIDNSRFTLLKEFLNSYNITIKKEDIKSIESLKKIYNEIDENENSEYIKKIISIYLSKSEYSGECFPHLSIGTNEYSFFTSPIRRYADIITHRIIKSILHNNDININKEAVILKLNNEYKKINTATKESENWLKCFYAENIKDKIFEAIITGTSTTPNYTLINLKIIDNGISGFLKIKNSVDNSYIYNEMKLITKHKQYKIGETLKVKINNINFETKKIEFFEIK